MGSLRPDRTLPDEGLVENPGTVLPCTDECHFDTTLSVVAARTRASASTVAAASAKRAAAPSASSARPATRLQRRRHALQRRALQPRRELPIRLQRRWSMRGVLCYGRASAPRLLRRPLRWRQLQTWRSLQARCQDGGPAKTSLPTSATCDFACEPTAASAAQRELRSRQGLQLRLQLGRRLPRVGRRVPERFQVHLHLRRCRLGVPESRLPARLELQLRLHGRRLQRAPQRARSV